MTAKDEILPLINKIKGDPFKDIPPDRNDESCIFCDGGIMIVTGFWRRVDENHTQDISICDNCKNYAVMIFEEYTERCPTCGEEGVLKKSWLEEILEKQKKTKWQPIETAPKEGTTFLAYEFVAPFENNNGGDYIHMCYWWDGDNLNSSRWTGSFANPPSHWMPLPAAPE